jgi:DNA polymerase-1
MEGVVLNIVETWDEAQLFMSWLGERRPIMACDTETGGLEWWREPIRLVQFGDAHTGWVVPWDQWGGLAKDALRRYTDELVFHNLKFDMHFLERNGCELRRDRLHDTRSMAHILDPVNSTGLKQLGMRFIDSSADAGQQALKKGMRENGWTWGTVPVDFPPYWIYSALDPVLTCRLYELFKPQLTARLLDVYELEVATDILLCDMEVRGARVDVPYCQEKQIELLAFAEEARRWCTANYGFGPGSNKAVAAQLQADGVTLSARTDSGAWSVAEAVLKGIDHPLAQLVLNVRKTEKYANSYFGNYIGMADGDILHPDVNPLGARTGRMSVSRPALQQIPRSKLLRDPFIPRDGNRLLSVDFDQVEMRLLAHFSGDEGLAASFDEDGDFFTNMGRRLFDEPTFDSHDPRRSGLVKPAAYAKVYGSGVATFAATAGIPEDTAQAFMSTFDTTFPGIRVFMKAVEQLARTREADEGVAYVCTPLGRRLPADADRLYSLVNYLIQGTAADIFKQTLINLDRRGLAEYLVLPVHDEAVFDVPAELVDELAVDVVDTFTRTDWRVPLTAGADIVDRWGEKYE